MELLSTLSSGDEFWDELKRENLDNRRLIFNCSVTEDIIEDLILYIFKWNMEDKDLPVEKRKPIWLIINSPGGDAIIGSALIDVIDQSLTPVYTLGVGMVASAAFCIYICGKKRYAFPNTTFLMHDGNVTISNSTNKARDTMEYCEELERRSKENILSHTNITEETYKDNFNKELYMYADDKAKELGCVDYVIGIDCGFDAIL